MTRAELTTVVEAVAAAVREALAPHIDASEPDDVAREARELWRSVRRRSARRREVR